MKCDHCDNEAEYRTTIWFLCPQCLEEWKDGMKAQSDAGKRYETALQAIVDIVEEGPQTLEDARDIAIEALKSTR